MGHIQGEVTSANETTKDGKDRYGVKIGGDWFNGFGKCPVKKGDKVNIEYITNGKWQNITNITVEAPSMKTNKSPTAGDRAVETTKRVLDNIDGAYSIASDKLLKDLLNRKVGYYDVFKVVITGTQLERFAAEARISATPAQSKEFIEWLDNAKKQADSDYAFYSGLVSDTTKRARAEGENFAYRGIKQKYFSTHSKKPEERI